MHLKKVAQLLSRRMHFATELAEFYISYISGVLTWYTLLIGWLLHGLSNFRGNGFHYRANNRLQPYRDTQRAT